MARGGLRGWGSAAAVVAMVAQLAWGQATPDIAAGGDAALAAFDVVSVKPVDPNTKITFVGLQYTQDGIKAGHMTIAMLIRAAYGGFMKMAPEDAVSGLPEWAKTDAFDIEAKMSPEQAAAFAKLDKHQQEAARETMLQALLADRFRLKVHREPKQVPDYELVVAKNGPKFKEGDTNPNAPKDKDGNPMSGSYLMTRRMGEVQAQAISMEQLANFLGQGSMGVGRMVKDKTGLTGKYSFTLNWTPDAGLGSGAMGGLPAPPPPSSASPAGAPDDSAPSLFTALQEQLGLKLQPGTGTIDTVVVEHVERPSVD